MRIMVDTNILISALVFGGKVRHTLHLLFNLKHDIYVSEYVENEFKRILYEKWSDRAEKIYSKYKRMNFIRCQSTDEILGTLRDEKDIPVLSDAIFHNVDILLTGDKDFLEADIDTPIIISPTELLEYVSKIFLEAN
ncbi:MAG: putative toxin-antitoxin system toxin component, PIN family [Selenomonadaceae bacterium]|nr:putative toxin-antitoxin system toxin component, PIN family [Selenomonadaceae bacterium]